MAYKLIVTKKLDRRAFLNKLGLNTIGTFAAGQLLSAGVASAADGANPQPVPQGPITSAAVGLTGIIRGNVGTDFCGLSYEKSSMSTPLFQSTNSRLSKLFNLLGNSYLRIGGISVDETTWNPSGAGQTGGAVSQSDIDRLAGFIRTTGWKVIYGVNFLASTPALAAAEAAYAASALGTQLYAIQLGNGSDIYNRGPYPATWGVPDFLAQWEAYATAIRAQTPGIALVGPGTASLTDWFNSFAMSESKQVLGLTHNYYRGNGADPASTASFLVSYPDTKLQSILVSINAGAVAAGLPFRLTETNSFYSGAVPDVTDAYASALWVIDHLFTIALAGGSGANLHGGGNSVGYTPIADANGFVQGPRPEFFGMYLFTQAGAGQVEAPDILAGGLNISAFAIHGDDGGLNIVIVNKDPAQAINVTLATGVKVTSATLTLMTNSSLSATTGTVIQGAAINADGSYVPGTPYTLASSGRTVKCYVNPLSAALIQVNSPRHTRDRTLPPWGGRII